MLGAPTTQGLLTKEDKECIRIWNDYIMLDRLPHELGSEFYREDIEAIKTMKKWSQERQQRESKKEAMKQKTLEKVKSLHGH